MRQTKIDTLFKEKAKGKLKGRGSRFSGCSLIKLLFSNLLLSKFYWLIIPLRMYFKVTWSGFCQHYQRWIYCRPKGFIFLLMNLQLFAHKLIRWLPGECVDWFFDNTDIIICISLSFACIDDTACSGRKNSMLINERALNRENYPLIVTRKALLNLFPDPLRRRFVSNLVWHLLRHFYRNSYNLGALFEDHTRKDQEPSKTIPYWSANAYAAQYANTPPPLVLRLPENTHIFHSGISDRFNMSRDALVYQSASN